jgi:hypothetical protein
MSASLPLLADIRERVEYGAIETEPTHSHNAAICV